MNAIQKTVEYFRSAKGEMEKVSWPSKQDTIRYSALVIGLSLGVAVFFATLDFGLTKLVDASLSARQPSTEQPSDIDLTPVTPTTAPVETTPVTPTTNPTPDLKNAQPIETPKL